MHRHPRDFIHISEECPNPLPRCELCGMQMPFAVLHKASHYGSKTCLEGQMLQAQHLREEAATKRATEQVFTAYGAPLDAVTKFKHLVQERAPLH